MDNIHANVLRSAWGF